MLQYYWNHAFFFFFNICSFIYDHLFLQQIFIEYQLSAGNFVCFPAPGQVGCNINKFVLKTVSFVNTVLRGIISGGHFWETMIIDTEFSR